MPELLLQSFQATSAEGPVTVHFYRQYDVHLLTISSRYATESGQTVNQIEQEHFVVSETGLVLHKNHPR
jgi:hypothetical protein